MADEWYVGRQGQRSGPFSDEAVRRMVAAGEIRPTDLVWQDGMVDWAPLSTVRELVPAPATSPIPLVPSTFSDNPYAAPAAGDLAIEVIADASGRPLRYADFLKRVGAALLDGIFLQVLTCIPVIATFAVAGVLAGGASDGAMAVAQVFAQALGLGIGLAYYIFLETSAKQGTWGKQIVGIKVTDLEGRRITMGRATGRYFAKIISGCTLGIGYLTPLFTEKKQTLHDMIAGCLALDR